ncbi:hypothetical protein HHI36_000801 [Cryptolaemus montrouzieri]|uniref:Uncharacterized protein n=1 Tax=Cryptolaemus montrouzieri TaxID=559131 RepID=A0ABD2P6J2_9CUCU
MKSNKVCNTNNKLDIKVTSHKGNSTCVFHQYVQCLKIKMAELEAALYIMHERPSYVAITEHWYTDTEVQCMNLKRYKRLSAFAKKIQIHGGSSVLVDQRMIYVEEVEDITNEKSCVHRWSMKN